MLMLLRRVGGFQVLFCCLELEISLFFSMNLNVRKLSQSVMAGELHIGQGVYI